MQIIKWLSSEENKKKKKKSNPIKIRVAENKYIN